MMQAPSKLSEACTAALRAVRDGARTNTEIGERVYRGRENRRNVNRQAYARVCGKSANVLLAKNFIRRHMHWYTSHTGRERAYEHYEITPDGIRELRRG